MDTIGRKLTGMPSLEIGSGQTFKKEISDQSPKRGSRSVVDRSGIDLPSKRDDGARDDMIRSAIRGPLTAMTAMHMMPREEAREAIAFWVEVLRPYREEQILEAFSYFARNSGGKYPSPQAIIEAINKLGKRKSWNT